VDAQQVDTINFIERAFTQCSVIGGLLVDKRAKVELIQAMQQNMAQGFQIFLKFCNDEISKLIVGQAESSNPKASGMNSDVATEASQISEDYRRFDEKRMSHTLRTQIFQWFLILNGLPGRPPTIEWGGSSEEEASQLFEQLKNAKAAGLQPTEIGLEQINERCGIEFEMAPEPEPVAPGASLNGKNKKADAKAAAK
jgi:phage gp29-like protein